jgi:formamidase
MPREHLIAIDPAKPLAEEPDTGHNRWHEAIEPVLEVDPGDSVLYETREVFDGQLRPSSRADDLLAASLGPVHPLTGPVFVKGAEPGDLLEAEIVAIEADPWGAWGYTVQLPGFGFLRDEFPDPYIAHWRLGSEYAVSEQLPGVQIPCAPFPGVFGVAPSVELRREATEREAVLAERGGLALPPDPEEAVPADETIAAEALRTVPPRETGGNLDIKQTTPGVKLLLPVYTEGGLVSTATSTMPKVTARPAERRSRCARGHTSASAYEKARRRGSGSVILSSPATTTSPRRSSPLHGGSMRPPASVCGRKVETRAKTSRSLRAMHS